MAQENIEGVVTDPSGSPLQDAVIALFLTNKNASDGDQLTVQYTRTDSNGKYVIKDHPDANGTAQEWHVAGYYEDGTGEFNALSKPSVEASVGSAVPDAQNLQFRFEAVETQTLLASGSEVNEGETIDTWEDLASTNDLPANGSPIREDGINNRASVRTDGTDDDLQTAGVDFADSFTAAGVFRLRDTDVGDRQRIALNADGGGYGIGEWEGDLRFIPWGVTAITITSADTTPVYWLARYRHTDDALKVRINGSNVLDTTQNIDPNPNTLVIGEDPRSNNADYANCNHGAFLQWGVYEDDTTTDEIDNYLSGLFGL